MIATLLFQSNNEHNVNYALHSARYWIQCIVHFKGGNINGLPIC